MKVCCHINGFVPKLISDPQPAPIGLRGSAVGWREDQAREEREGWRDYRFVWEWLMEFPSLWAPLASVTKGLLKERRLRQEETPGQAELEWRMGKRHKDTLTWLCSTCRIHPAASSRWCSLPPGRRELAANRRCGWARGWRFLVASAAGWRRILRHGSLLPTETTSSLAEASCFHRAVSDRRYLSNKQTRRGDLKSVTCGDAQVWYQHGEGKKTRVIKYSLEFIQITCFP